MGSKDLEGRRIWESFLVGESGSLVSWQLFSGLHVINWTWARCNGSNASGRNHRGDGNLKIYKFGYSRWRSVGAVSNRLGKEFELNASAFTQARISVPASFVASTANLASQFTHYIQEGATPIHVSYVQVAMLKPPHPYLKSNTLLLDICVS